MSAPVFQATETVLRAPSVEYRLLAPMLIVIGAGIAAVVVEAFVPQRFRYGTQVVLSVGACAAAFGFVVSLAGTSSSAIEGAVIVDGPTLFLQGATLLVAILTFLLIAERRLDTAPGGGDAFAAQAATVPGTVAEREAVRAGITQTEVYPLTLLAVGGMLLFPASGDLLTMFIALEVLSLPLYLLCGIARRRRMLSQEAALKYFLLGAFSSAFFLYGVALLYGYAGTVDLDGIRAAVAAGDGDTSLALIGASLLAIGLLFKVGAVPFHSWVPDVYQGAPTPITAFMAAATKIAAFGALLRVFYVALPDLRVDWRPVLWGIAIATMLVGAILAVTQDDVKRMLAYSSVAHAGFILTGVIAADSAGLAAVLFYLLTYGIGTLGAFVVVSLVRDKSGEVTAMDRWAGLGRRSPLFGTVFAVLLLALAGIPLTSGFIAKFAVFNAAAGAGAAPLVIVGVLSSAIAAYFYVRVIVLMFFPDEPDDSPEIVVPSLLTTGTLAVSVIVTVVLGIFPQPVLDLAEKAAVFYS